MAEDGCGLLSGWAMRLFRGKSLEEVQGIAFEIGILGQNAQDINDPKEICPTGAAEGSDKQLSLHLFVL